MGFHQSKSDYSLFIWGFSPTFIVVLVSVDDIIMTGAPSTNIDKLKGHLNTFFHLKETWVPSSTSLLLNLHAHLLASIFPKDATYFNYLKTIDYLPANQPYYL